MLLKRISCILGVLMLLSVFAGCSSSNSQETQDTMKTEQKKINVVCTIFPQYDWVRRILGGESESVNASFLIDSGIDLHNYKPSAEDIVAVSGCDLFISVGGESDAWVENVLTQATNPDMIVLNLLDILGEKAKEEQALEGMQETEEAEAEAEEAAPEYDEHVWLSLKNAAVCCEAIKDALISLDPQKADQYATNEKAYLSELNALDGEYQTAVASAKRTTLLVADRFPFRYLADDYGLTCYAAFSGCSAETEASFETVSFLAAKVDELNLSSILVLEDSDQSIAKTVINNTNAKNQKVLVLNSLQAITAADATGETSYLSAMRANLEVLKSALN